MAETDIFRQNFAVRFGKAVPDAGRISQAETFVINIYLYAEILVLARDFSYAVDFYRRQFAFGLSNSV